MCVREPQRQILPSEFALCCPMGTYSLGEHFSFPDSPWSGGDICGSHDGVLHTSHIQVTGKRKKGAQTNI